jgi:hypothetical protein
VRNRRRRRKDAGEGEERAEVLNSSMVKALTAFTE